MFDEAIAAICEQRQELQRLRQQLQEHGVPMDADVEEEARMEVCRLL